MEEDIKKIADEAELSPEAAKVLLDEREDDGVFKEVFKGSAGKKALLKVLFEHPDTPHEVRTGAAAGIGIPASIAEELKAEIAQKQKVEILSKEEKELRLIQRLRNMTVGEKLKLAMRANKEVRSILMKDSNKMIVMAVVNNPKLTESEVELIAKSRSIPEDALRVVAKNKEWIKNYAILYGLVTNPKTPAGVSMGFLPYLKPKDLQLLERNKNVPEALRIGAKRLAEAKKKTR